MVVVHPIRKEWVRTRGFVPLMRVCPSGRHVIHLSLSWAEALKVGLADSCAEIGRQVGIPTRRVRKIVALVKLRPEIVAFLQALRSDNAIKPFPPHHLRTITPLPQERPSELLPACKRHDCRA